MKRIFNELTLFVVRTVCFSKTQSNVDFNCTYVPSKYAFRMNTDRYFCDSLFLGLQNSTQISRESNNNFWQIFLWFFFFAILWWRQMSIFSHKSRLLFLLFFFSFFHHFKIHFLAKEILTEKKSSWKEIAQINNSVLALEKTEIEPFLGWNRSGSISSMLLRTAFMLKDPVSAKSCLSWLSFCAFGIYAPKSCTLNVGKIDPWNKKEEVDMICEPIFFLAKISLALKPFPWYRRFKITSKKEIMRIIDPEKKAFTFQKWI